MNTAHGLCLFPEGLYEMTLNIYYNVVFLFNMTSFINTLDHNFQ